MPGTETPPPDEARAIAVSVSIPIGDARIDADVTVPAGPVPLAELMPIFRAFAEAVVDHAVATERTRGRQVSCREGCAACCRQLVAISEVEARVLRDLVASLPEPRRSAVRHRFVEARERLRGAGLLDRLDHPERFSDDELGARALSLPYLRLGIACPFLEDEACSIYTERPIACREYLVTSPPALCANPGGAPIAGVMLPRKASVAVTRIGVSESARFTRWVPLIVALDWADAHADDLGKRPGVEWLRAFFDALTGGKARADGA